MKFEEALKAMFNGKKVRRIGDANVRYYFIKNGIVGCLQYNCKDEVGVYRFTVDEVMSDQWEIFRDYRVSEEKNDKIDIKITFIGGGEIVILDEQWDDYRYDGKFFTIIKDGADIAMYNAKQVFSFVLVRQGD